MIKQWTLWNNTVPQTHPWLAVGGKKTITLEKSEEKCSCEMSVSNRKHAV